MIKLSVMQGIDAAGRAYFRGKVAIFLHGVNVLNYTVPTVRPTKDAAMEDAKKFERTFEA